MPEAIHSYPRWERAFTRTPGFVTIASQELRKIYYDRWTGYALIAFLLLAALNFASSQQTRTSLTQLTDTLKFLDWGALAVAAIAAGPALLEDKRQGALELYLSRAVTRPQYLLGKTLAVWAATFLVVFLPAFLYYMITVFSIDTLPEGWGWVWLGLLGHAAIWATVISGLGLGLSAALRSGRAASLVLFGVVFGLDALLSNALANISNAPEFQLLSPVANLQQQNAWLFQGGVAPYDFPWWWSLLVLAGLAIVGWGLVAWRHPRIRGVE